MRRLLRRRLAGNGGQAGITFIEMLVAATMGVIVLGATGSLVISAMRTQPQISKRAQNITTARWVLERLTRELRNGRKVEAGASSSSVSFTTYVRHSSCGTDATLESGQAAIECRVTYSCTTSSCSRTEAAPASLPGSGTERTIFSGIDSSNVFSYSPSADAPTYVRVTLRMPNPSGPGRLTVSDGASLRNATLAY